MRRLILSATILVLALPRPAWSSGHAFDRQTLDTARALAGLERANLPIARTSVLPASASRGVEAWTFYGADGNAERIFVYTGSDMFRCANWPLVMRQCVIRLASVLVHEAWHFERGRSEAEAYEAQIAFLMCGVGACGGCASGTAARHGRGGEVTIPCGCGALLTA